MSRKRRNHSAAVQILLSRHEGSVLCTKVRRSFDVFLTIEQTELRRWRDA